MKLYHGTSERAARQIMEEGLLPRSARRDRKGNWNHTIISHKDAVYLTSAYALYFAIASTEDAPELKTGADGLRVAVIEVDTALLDEACLVPDEDVVEQSNRGRESPDLPPSYHGWSMERRTRYWRKRLSGFSMTGAWRASLHAMGTCAHLGAISPSAITRVAFVPLRGAPNACAMAMDPTISILNYRFVGKKYRALTKWVFGDPMGADEPEAYPKETAIHLPNFPTHEFALPDAKEQATIEILNLTEKEKAA